MARLPEVRAAGELAHHDEVDAAHHLGPQRGVFDEARMHAHRAQVGEHLERGAQPEQAGAGALVTGEVVPFRSADGAEQHRVRGPGRRQALRGQRCARLVDGAATDEVLLDDDVDARACRGGAQHRDRLVGDLRPDAVAGQRHHAHAHTGSSTRLRSGIHTGRAASYVEMRVLVVQRHGDLVEPLEQLAPLTGLELELEAQVAGGDGAVLEIDDALHAGLLGGEVEQRANLVLGQGHRQEPTAERVALEDVCEGGGYDRAEALILQRPHGMLARGSTAEVAARDQNGPSPIGGCVEHEFRALGSRVVVA